MQRIIPRSWYIPRLEPFSSLIMMLSTLPELEDDEGVGTLLATAAVDKVITQFGQNLQS